MNEREENRLVCSLAMLIRDLKCSLKRAETLYARYAPDAHKGLGAKESKERDIPPTPPIEKETKEKIKT